MFLIADKGLGKTQAIKEDAVTSFLRFQKSCFQGIYSRFGECVVISVEADTAKGRCDVCMGYCLGLGKGDLLAWLLPG